MIKSEHDACQQKMTSNVTIEKYLLMIAAIALLFLNIDSTCWAGTDGQASTGNTTKYQASVKNSQVKDLIKEWHFKAIGDVFLDGQNRVLLVRTENNQSAFWNPLTNTLSAPLNLPWGHSPKLPFLNAAVHHKMSGSLKPWPSDNSFANGAKIYQEGGSSGHCGPNFVFYYTVENKDGSTDSFYIITRCYKPVTYESCDEEGPTMGIAQNFDAPITIETIDIGNGRTLLFAPSGNDLPFWDNYPVLLEVTSIPKSVWTSDKNIFLVPRKDLEKAFRFENDLAIRYNAVLKAIGEPSVSDQ
jgi:hypothetical protein